MYNFEKTEKDVHIVNGEKYVTVKDYDYVRNDCVIMHNELIITRKERDSLKKERDTYKDELAKLKEKLKSEEDKNSQSSANSSQPGSQDRLNQKSATSQDKKNKKGRRKPGGQVGHRGHSRKREEPDEIITLLPEDTCECGGNVKVSDKHSTHQKVDIPVQKKQVTDYHLHAGCCQSCGEKYKAKLPKGHGIRINQFY